MTDLRLYNYFRSSTSYRVRIALNLKKIPFEYFPIHLLNNGGEQNTTAYRDLNPIGGVPTLKHGNKIISQSMAILEYLEEVFPNTESLLPQDPFLKAKIRQFCENINADIHPLQNLKLMQYLESKHNYTQEDKNLWCQKWIQQGLDACEKLILPFAKNYCFGEQLTIADVILIPQLFSAERFKVNLLDFPLLFKIQENCIHLSAFKMAHPYRQIDTPQELKII